MALLAPIYTTLVIAIVIMTAFAPVSAHARRQHGNKFQAAGRSCSGQIKQQALQVTDATNVILLHLNSKTRKSKTTAVAIQAKCSDGSTLFTAKCNNGRLKFASGGPKMYLNMITTCESLFIALLLSPSQSAHVMDSYREP